MRTTKRLRNDPAATAKRQSPRPLTMADLPDDEPVAADLAEPAEPAKPKIPSFDVAGLADERWNLIVAAGLRVARSDDGDSRLPLAPSNMLPQALDYVTNLLPDDFWRLEQLFDWSRKKRKGSIKISEELDGRIKSLMPLFAEGRKESFKRQLAGVALYAYALHLQGLAQKRAYGFVAEDIAASLSDPKIFDQVRKATGIKAARLQEYCNDADRLASELADGSAMIDATKIYQAQGRNPLQVLHTASVSGTASEFRILLAQNQENSEPGLRQA